MGFTPGASTQNPNLQPSTPKPDGKEGTEGAAPGLGIQGLPQAWLLPSCEMEVTIIPLQRDWRSPL